MGIRKGLERVYEQMRIPEIKCACSELILKSMNGTSKVRAKILVIKDDSVYAICKSCSSEVKVPLKVTESTVYPPLFVKT